MTGCRVRKLFLLSAVLVTSLMTCLLWSSEAVTPEEKAPEIALALIDSLEFNYPVILDVRCGEWTPALDREMRRLLLERQVELREISFGLLKESNEFLPPAMESDLGINGARLLQMLKVPKADYLELSLEQSVESGEKRSFLAYSRYRIPVYRFVLKQIALPEQRLVSIKETRFNGEPEPENAGSFLAMKWYEPVIASALIGSLIYMLWTFK